MPTKGTRVKTLILDHRQAFMTNNPQLLQASSKPLTNSQTKVRWNLFAKQCLPNWDIKPLVSSEKSGVWCFQRQEATSRRPRLLPGALTLLGSKGGSLQISKRKWKIKIETTVQA